jgi:D-glycero-alpha-D-manno-heptose-7-phosphate kinase
MIITRSPLRITLGGGGTDLPSYYRQHGGFLIAAAIDKYVYVTGDAAVRRGHLPQVLEARARRARSRTCSIRSSARAIRMLEFRTPQVEITTLADIPAGTGLGSSGSFSTALLEGALRGTSAGVCCIPTRLATRLRDRDHRCGEPIGKQDLVPSPRTAA